MSSAACIISTYGDYGTWGPKAENAARSADLQSWSFDQVICSHGETLHEARNNGADLAHTEWLVFLDADDELDYKYCESMLNGKGDIRQPATLGIVNGVEDDFPVVIPERNLAEANYIVIGAFVRREQFLRVGGFDAYPVLEDWALWIKCKLDGASILPCPEAIYRVHVNLEGRNNQADLHGQVYSQIRQQYGESLRNLSVSA